MPPSDTSTGTDPGDRHRLPPGRPVTMRPIPDSPRYSMKDLMEATELSDRTIRYYITQKLLQPAQGRGPAATYTKDHLLRLKMIEELKTTKNLSIENIRVQLYKMSTADLEAHFAISTRAIEGRWRRVLFHPNLELNIREQNEPDLRFENAVDDIIKYARLIMEQLEVR